MFDFFGGLRGAAIIFSAVDDIPTEVETRSSSRRRRAAVTPRLVLLAGCAPKPIASVRRERNRELSEEAFDIGLNHFNNG